MRNALACLAVLAVVVLTVRPAAAGPPLICHPIDIGDADSLPWGDGPPERRGSYRADQVVRDALAHLHGDTRVLVRMETIRRAALYLQDDHESAAALRAALWRRVLDAEAAGRPRPRAWFDAGYLQQTLAQLGAHAPARRSAEIDGYAWIERVWRSFDWAW